MTAAGTPPWLPPDRPSEVPMPPGFPHREPFPRPVYPPVPQVPIPGEPPAPGGFESTIYAALLERRIVFVRDRLDHDTATLVTAQLMTLDADDTTPVTLVVNSGGGPIDAVAGLLDTIDLLRCPVDTSCVGRAEGTAAVVVAAGSGRRRCGPGATFRLRLPDLEAAGPADRLRRDVESATQLQRGLVDRLAAITGQSRALVARDVERGRLLTAGEAIAYGLVDEVAGG
ncbi:MAG TPA: ATP-dependent Clp protease proteolytic subunit [Acidimicrobiales bacterium]|jgi:ATP-dependent Clp protease, protease subunit